MTKRFYDEIHTVENFSANSVKERILHELAKAASGPMEYVRQASFILEVLNLTDGLWNDLAYSYKAREICEQIINQVREYKIEVAGTTNNKQILKRLEILQEFAQKQSVTFHRLQSDKFCDTMNINDPQTREISRMTNTELAC